MAEKKKLTNLENIFTNENRPQRHPSENLVVLTKSERWDGRHTQRFQPLILNLAAENPYQFLLIDHRSVLNLLDWVNLDLRRRRTSVEVAIIHLQYNHNHSGNPHVRMAHVVLK